jgi:hypothetical protein
VERFASTCLWTNGGFDVVLQLPGLAVSGSDAEQMGLATPQFQDVPVGPAVWRKVGANRALLLGSAGVAALMGSQGFASAESLFETAVGVVVAGVFYLITDCEPLLAAGEPCAYRLAVQAPAWS